MQLPVALDFGSSDRLTCLRRRHDEELVGTGALSAMAKDIEIAHALRAFRHNVSDVRQLTVVAKYASGRFQHQKWNVPGTLVHCQRGGNGTKSPIAVEGLEVVHRAHRAAELKMDFGEDAIARPALQAPHDWFEFEEGHVGVRPVPIDPLLGYPRLKVREAWTRPLPPSLERLFLEIPFADWPHGRVPDAITAATQVQHQF